MKISVIGIIYGTIIDLLGSICAGCGMGIMFGFLFSFYFIHQGMQPGAALEFKVRAMVYTVPIQALCIFVGWFFTFLGGFFAAKVAGGRSPLLNSGIVGVNSIILAIVAHHYYFPEVRIVTWAFCVGLAGSIPVSLLGGLLIRSIVRAYRLDEEPDDEDYQESELVI